MTESVESPKKIKIELVQGDKLHTIDVPPTVPPELFIKDILIPFGVMWKIDYKTVPQELAKDWVLADIKHTASYFLKKGFPVVANDTLYRNEGKEDLERVVGEIVAEITSLCEQGHKLIIEKMPDGLLISLDLDSEHY